MENSPKIIPRWILIAFIITAFIGFADATYLTVEHYRGSGINCAVFEGCDIVANSEYAVIFGIPTALLGGLFYLGMLLFTIIYFDIRKKFLLYLLCLGGFFGFGFSIFLVYLQAVVIEAFCDYCMISATTSTLLFVWSLFTIEKLRTKN